MKASSSWRLFAMVALFAIVLSACGGTPAPTAAPEQPAQPAATAAPAATVAPAATDAPAEPVTLVVMGGNNLDQAIEEYMALNPNVTIERVDKDDTKLAAMFAAGTPPDLFVKSGADTAVFETRGWILDLTPYFEASTVLKPDDMVDAVGYFKTDKGWYGMHKDWSYDSALIINKRMADEAGIVLPPPNSIITYDQFAEWVRLLAKKDGERVVTMGYSGFGYVDGPLQNILAETGEELYSADFSHANIKDNPTVVKFLTYAAGLAKENVVWNPLTPDPNWSVPDMLDGNTAIISTGFWANMSFATAKNPVEDPANFVMYPALSWGGEVVTDRCQGGEGMFIAAQSKQPAEAFKFFEYWMGGKPAVDRAKGGWGLPALKSLSSLTPAETDWQKQWLATVEWETNSPKVIKTPRKINPYCSTSVMNNVWSAQLEQYLKGTITLEQAIETLDTEVNQCIADGMAAAGK